MKSALDQLTTHRRTTAWTALILGMSMTSVALAQSGGERTIVIVNAAEDARVHSIILQDVKQAVSKVQGYTLKDIHGPLNAGGEVESQNNIRAAAAFYETGMKAFESGDYEEASDQLDNAASMMAADLAVLTDMSMYKRALLALGASWVALGESREAAQVFRRAILARATPDILNLNEDAMTARQREELRMNDSELGAVMIESFPEHVAVYINGRYRGITPVTVAGLPVGEHILGLSKPGFTRQTRAITINAERMEIESADLEPARRKPQYDQLVERLEAELQEVEVNNGQGGPGIQSIGTLLFGELALVVNIDGPSIAKQIELSLFDTQTQRRLNHVSREVDWTRRNKKAIKAMVEELVTIDFGQALGGAGEAEFGQTTALSQDTKVWETWWFWTIIGSAVLGGTTAGLVLGLAPDDSGPAPTGGTISVQF